jgi:Skp family chaperone for outer membrane proteins
MRVFRLLTVTTALLALAIGSAMAQTTPAPAPNTQKPTTPAPAAPTPAAPPPATAEAPRPYPEGAKIAYIDMQGIASGSNEGKAFSARIAELTKKKTAEIAEKNKALDSARQKQQSSVGIMNDTARLALEKEIDKLTREVQFAQQEAQSEVQQLQTELQVDFQKKLNPILEQIGKEKGLHMLVDIQNSGAVWVDTGLDLTNEIIKRLDSATKAAPKK